MESKSWDQEPFAAHEGAPTLARGFGTDRLAGDLEAESVWQGLTVARPDGSAQFVGLHRVVGRLAGRRGSFVLQSNGTVTPGGVSGSWTVVPGTATGDLRGLRGEGGFAPIDGQKYSFTLRYDFD
jgi:hypothetical protein